MVEGVRAFQRGLPSTFATSREWLIGWAIAKRRHDRQTLTSEELEAKYQFSEFWKGKYKGTTLGTRKPFRGAKWREATKMSRSRDT